METLIWFYLASMLLAEIVLFHPASDILEKWMMFFVVLCPVFNSVFAVICLSIIIVEQIQKTIFKISINLKNYSYDLHYIHFGSGLLFLCDPYEDLVADC